MSNEGLCAVWKTLGYLEYEGEGEMDEIHELSKLMWTTENMPRKWNTGVICQKYKKGDKVECINYRRIKLFTNAYKIFSSILNGRLKLATEKIIGD